jgi:hypothetical protein
MLVLILTGLLLALSPAASAHVVETSGQFRVTMGWGVEPALSGAQNLVEVSVQDASGAPVRARAGDLSVEVSFGGSARTLPLAPDEESGGYRAVLVPTRPGTYAFHVTGTLRGKPVDVRATCSERTFDCVQDAAAFQFPAREPSTGEVAQRADRETARATRDAQDSADDARTLALVAVVVAVLALVAAVVLGLRGRRARP